ITRLAVALAGARPRKLMRSPVTPTSAYVHGLPVPSTTRPLRMRMSYCCATRVNEDNNTNPAAHRFMVAPLQKSEERDESDAGAEVRRAALNLHKNFLPVQPSSDQRPQRHIADGESKGGVDRSREWREPVAINPCLHANNARALAHLENESLFREKSGKRICQNGVRPQPNERPAPSAPAAHLDQPQAQRQQQAGGPRGEQHVGTGPQRLVDGEEWMPRVT